jgi:transposase
MKDEIGSIRTGIQGQGCGAFAAARERVTRGRGARGWRRRGHPLERWRSEALSKPARERAWTAAARFDAVLTTAAMDEAAKSAWCRANGVYLQDLTAWRQSATQALANPEELRASPNQTKQDRRRIKELERDLRRKNAALAETAALLVLSKQMEAIFNKGGEE